MQGSGRDTDAARQLKARSMLNIHLITKPIVALIASVRKGI